LQAAIIGSERMTGRRTGGVKEQQLSKPLAVPLLTAIVEKKSQQQLAEWMCCCVARPSGRSCSVQAVPVCDRPPHHCFLLPPWPLPAAAAALPADSASIGSRLQLRAS